MKTFQNGDKIEADKMNALKMRQEGWQQNHGWLYLPSDYFTSGKKYPYIAFYHGAGENGNMDAVLHQGLPANIQSGQIPKASDGTEFIVYAVSEAMMSGPNTWINGPQDFHFLIEYYGIRIDTNRCYTTGLSSGGNASLAMAAMNPDIFVAAVPMSTIWWNLEQSDNLMAGLKKLSGIWQLHGESDLALQSSVDRARNSIIDFNKNNPDYQVLLTAYPGGHGGWEDHYDPSWRWTEHRAKDVGDPNGLNIYDWMLLHKKGEEQPPVNPPVDPPTEQPPVDPVEKTITKIIVEYSDGTTKEIE